MRISFLIAKLHDNGVRFFVRRISKKFNSWLYNTRYNCRISIPSSSSVFGRSYIDFGDGVIIGERCKIEAVYSHGKDRFSPKIKIGNNTTMNDDVHIGCIESVTIGNNILMASRIYISDHNHGSYGYPVNDSPELAPNNRQLVAKSVCIEDNVWIGEGVVILPGVTVGRGSIIGANSVVTKSVPPYCIAAGVPAKIVKVYNAQIAQWESVR